MNNELELNKWLDACQEYIKLNSKYKLNQMKTNEERIQQLELAHSRLFNQFNTLHQDFINYREVVQEELKKLSKHVGSTIFNKDIFELPLNLLNGTEYHAIIHSIYSSKPVKWKDMDYVNWELKLVGKEDYIHLAFIPAGTELVSGDKVKFTYKYPHKLMKLKKI